MSRFGKKVTYVVIGDGRDEEVAAKQVSLGLGRGGMWVHAKGSLQLFSAGTLFPGLNPSGQGETLPLMQEISHCVKRGNVVAIGGLKFQFYCCSGLV